MDALNIPDHFRFEVIHFSSKVGKTISSAAVAAGPQWNTQRQLRDSLKSISSFNLDLSFFIFSAAQNMAQSLPDRTVKTIPESVRTLHGYSN